MSKGLKTGQEQYDELMASIGVRGATTPGADSVKKAPRAPGRKGDPVGLREVLITEASGATSFADLEASRALQVKVDALYQRIEDLSTLVEGIFWNTAVTDKGAALRALLQEFAGVVDEVLAEAYRGSR